LVTAFPSMLSGIVPAYARASSDDPTALDPGLDTLASAEDGAGAADDGAGPADDGAAEATSVAAALGEVVDAAGVAHATARLASAATEARLNTADLVITHPSAFPTVLLSRFIDGHRGSDDPSAVPSSCAHRVSPMSG
jgi:hypothetical protein